MDAELIKQLTEVQTKLDMLMQMFSNHLQHHFWYTTFAYSVMAGLIVTLVVHIIKTRK